jgi:predicted deacylase
VRREIELGDGYQLEIEEFAGARPGAVLAVLGGVHGDELEGVTAARVFRRYLDALPADALRGTVRIVAVSNPAAFAARQRCSPVDGANLARVFPGTADGTLTQRIAHAITTQVIAGADLMVDLHSAGMNYEMPVFAGYIVDTPTGPRSGAATYAFGAPVVWEHVGGNPGRSMSAAEDLGVPSIYVEGSGGGGLVGDDLDVYVAGLIRLAQWLEIIDGPLAAPQPPLVFSGEDGDTDESLACSTDGFCVTRVRSGARVAKATLLAEILDEHGNSIEQLFSPRDGTVMMLRRRAEVQAGDGIVMLGPLPAGPIPVHVAPVGSPA